MKKAVLIILISLIHISQVFSQSPSFMDANNLWSVLHISSEVHVHPDDGYPFYKTTWYRIKGDTLINETSYKKLQISNDSLQSNWSYKGALREEGQKVYYFDNYNYYNESILYDFDIKVNDTIQMIYIPGEPIQYCLDSISTEKVDSVELKIFHFTTFLVNHPDQKIKDTWIMGIGSTRGPLWFQSCSFIMPCYSSYQLMCFEQSDTVLYSNPDYNRCFIDSLVLSSNIQELNSLVNIFPNPATYEINILTHSNTLILGIELFDISGNCLYQNCTTKENKFKFDISAFSKGIYILKVETSEGELSKRIIIQ